MNLNIDLGQIQANYQLIDNLVGSAHCAAVVKANAYGLGCVKVAEALRAVGCRHFFVANIDEGIELRAALADVDIYVLNGATHTDCEELTAAQLIPVLNSLSQIHRWSRLAKGKQCALQAVIHLDTGMNRTGLSASEAEKLFCQPWLLENIDVVLVMSHLACAEVVGSTHNEQQLNRFTAYRSRLRRGRASLANSAGVFLGSAYHFNLVRCGVGLYGGNPYLHQKNPMNAVVNVNAPILQIREVNVGDTVGYGATFEFAAAGKVATVALGYADGFLRSTAGTAYAYIGSTRAPIVGRVSMDLITLDVSLVPESLLAEGTQVEFVGQNITIDQAAQNAGTIAHEFLALLGDRYRRTYVINQES